MTVAVACGVDITSSCTRVRGATLVSTSQVNLCAGYHCPTVKPTPYKTVLGTVPRPFLAQRRFRFQILTLGLGVTALAGVA
jgi:hypothetical protein